MDTLTSQQVTAELGTTPGWDVADGRLTRTVTRKDFRDALLYVNAIGYLAEQANHHPDIAIISWATGSGSLPLNSPSVRWHTWAAG